MLTRIRNANIAMHDDVRMPSSKLKEALAVVLQREGYIGGFEIEDDPEGPGRFLSIDMKYSPQRKRVISGLRRVSKPGLRVYRKYDEVERVLGGLGIAVLSTSKGLMTDREARRQRVGGEVLCHVW
jgi:small subunit ribosomal protein S8